ncbi:MAG: FG-GAP repeat protein [Planctomycetes bacterium]|nr:FG-GAP repeat protein [Planctomycetota bacterium]
MGAQCQRAKLTGEDGAQLDHFGETVAVSAGTAVVGAHGDDDNGPSSGSAYVFERERDVRWSLRTKLTASDGTDYDNFGTAASISAEAIIIGAHFDDDLGQRSGSAYVFERDPNGVWSQVAKLLANDGAAYDLFGSAVGASGDCAVIGAPEDNDNGYASGSAYVFGRDPNGVWTQHAKLLADDGDAADLFGLSVAIDGDIIAVGARDDEALGNWSGSAYVFERDAFGIWHQAAKLLPHDGSAFWSFGESVAISGNRVLVGATTAFSFAPAGGAAYMFERDPNGAWPEVAQLVSDDIANSDFFGIAVALDGDIAVVGSENADYNADDSGAAYVFVRQPDRTWPQVAKIGADDGAYDDRFGRAVGVSGNTAVVGAYYDDDYGQDSGSAYVFAVGPDEDGDGIMDVCLCPGDLDSDLDVDLSDLAQLLSNYGTTSGATYEDGDLDKDGDVDLADLAALLAEYGTICP